MLADMLTGYFDWLDDDVASAAATNQAPRDPPARASLDLTRVPSRAAAQHEAPPCPRAETGLWFWAE